LFRRADKLIRKGDSVMGEKELKTILKKHRAWLAGREGGERAILIGEDIGWSDFVYTDLKGAIIRESDLGYADLEGVDLELANLRGTSLRGANLRKSDIRCANIRDTDLRWSSLKCADLRLANFEGANLEGAILEGADLRGANLREADLRGADIDFSCLPLCCGSLTAHFDDRQLKQIAYHLVKAGLHSRNASAETKAELSKLIDFANGFHRVDECGRIEQV